MRFASARSRWLLAGAVVVVAAIAVVAVLLLTSGESEFDSVSDLAQVLEENNIRCEGLTVSPPEQTEGFGGEFGYCFIDQDTVNITVYEDPERVETHVELNVKARTNSPENENVFTHGVSGGNWVVDTYSRKTAEKVQEALGGSTF